MREIRLHGSEGGAAETNRSFLPLSLGWRHVNSATSKLARRVSRISSLVNVARFGELSPAGRPGGACGLIARLPLAMAT